MNTQDFVTLVRRSCVNELVDGYALCFDDLAIDSFTDRDMYELAGAWKAAEPDLREVMKSLIRLGAQNATAAILGLLDEDNGLHNPELLLSAKPQDGEAVSLRRDLLSTYWEQEELAGQVNKARR